MLKRRSTSWVGVDLGSRAIKLVELVPAGGGWRLGRGLVLSHAEPLPVDAGSPLPLPHLPPGLHPSRLRQAGFRSRRAGCLLSMPWTLLKTFKVPPGSVAERRAMIAHEIGSADEGERGETVFDYWDILGEGLSAGEGDVAVLAMAGETAAAAAQAVEALGLDCRVLDGLPPALARAAALAAPGEQRPQAVLDWGYATATFTVAAGGTAAFTRTLRDCGLRLLLEGVCQGLGLELEEAEQLLPRYGLPHPQEPGGRERGLQEAVAEVAAPRLRVMCEELQKTLAYLRAQRPALVPQRLWLMGGGATVRHMAEHLSLRLELPVECWRLPWQAENSAPQRTPVELLGPAAALALLGASS